ncbi:MAG TPA: serine/threonine-protein kinase, partial [Polyangiaceae bacterium]|nr:serine/threonine-protein kinase [Polyangiaceae bacterium]
MRDNETEKISLARIGTVINGKWTVERLIGVGGMASVYAATHRNSKRAALKIMHPELSAQATIRERFLREGYLANMVDHPGVVSIDDDDITEDGCAYLVMELVEGETLEARLRRKGPLPPEEVLSFMDQVLHALATAHTRGVVHRDLKPENMLLAQNGEVKLLDFGIARARALSTDPTKTLTDGLMGTPAFMPPEQARGRWEEVDAQSDVWALGATMFTLLTGRNVHQAATTNEALAVAMMRHAPKLEEYRADLPASLLELVNKALEFEKKDRWPNATVMLLAVRRASSRLEDETLEVEAAAAARAVQSDSQPDLFVGEQEASDTYVEGAVEAELSDPDAAFSQPSAAPAPASAAPASAAPAPASAALASSAASFDLPTNPVSSAAPLVDHAFEAGARRGHPSQPPKAPAPPRPSQRPPAPPTALPAPASGPSATSQPSRPPPPPAFAAPVSAPRASSTPALEAQAAHAFAEANAQHDDPDPAARIATPVYQRASASNPSATEGITTTAGASTALAIAEVSPSPTHEAGLPARRIVPFSDVPLTGAVVTRPTETTTARSALTAAVRAPSRQQWSLIGGVAAALLLVFVVASG